MNTRYRRASMRKILVNFTWMILGMFLTVFIITAMDISVHADQTELTIKVTAQKFEYSPKEITLKKGVPVVLELTSLDRLHGFACPDLHVRSDIKPGQASRVRILPEKAGKFGFHCDVFCGSGHEQMR